MHKELYASVRINVWGKLSSLKHKNNVKHMLTFKILWTEVASEK